MGIALADRAADVTFSVTVPFPGPPPRGVVTRFRSGYRTYKPDQFRAAVFHSFESGGELTADSEDYVPEEGSYCFATVFDRARGAWEPWSPN